MRFGRRSLTGVALCVALVIGAAGPVNGYAPESTPRRALEAAVYDAKTHPTARGAVMSAVLLRGGVVLASQSQGKALIPASLMKLTTTAAAILKFGPGHRFVTRIARVGGTPNQPQHLYVIGGGDSTLATASYRRGRFEPSGKDRNGIPAFKSGSPTVEQLVARIRDAGVTRVSGDLVLDETWFDKDRVPDGWPSRYFGYDAESAYASALIVNEGRTAPSRHYIVPNVALHAGQLIRREMADQGIRVAGSIRFGRTPSNAARVTSVSSPPLSEIVDFINRYSANYQAEILFKSLGAAFGTEGSYAAAGVVVRQALDELGVPRRGFNQEDGSGLSRDNRVTARTLSRLIEEILERPQLNAVRASIPVAGQVGTLQNRLDRAPTKDNLRGKTGYLRGVRGLAGWVTGPDGTPIVYVGLYNGAANALALSSPLDLLALAAAFHPRA